MAKSSNVSSDEDCRLLESLITLEEGTIQAEKESSIFEHLSETGERLFLSLEFISYSSTLAPPGSMNLVLDLSEISEAPSDALTSLDLLKEWCVQSSPGRKAWVKSCMQLKSWVYALLNCMHRIAKIHQNVLIESHCIVGVTCISGGGASVIIAHFLQKLVQCWMPESYQTLNITSPSIRVNHRDSQIASHLINQRPFEPSPLWLCPACTGKDSYVFGHWMEQNHNVNHFLQAEEAVLTTLAALQLKSRLNVQEGLIYVDACGLAMACQVFEKVESKSVHSSYQNGARTFPITSNQKNVVARDKNSLEGGLVVASGGKQGRKGEPIPLAKENATRSNIPRDVAKSLRALRHLKQCGGECMGGDGTDISALPAEYLKWKGEPCCTACACPTGVMRINI